MIIVTACTRYPSLPPPQMIDILGKKKKYSFLPKQMFYRKQSLSTHNSVGWGGGGCYVLVSLNLHAVAIGKKLQTNQKLQTLV